MQAAGDWLGGWRPGWLTGGLGWAGLGWPGLVWSGPVLALAWPAPGLVWSGPVVWSVASVVWSVPVSCDVWGALACTRDLGFEHPSASTADGKERKS